MNDSVGIDVESDLYLGNSPGSSRNSGKFEIAEGLVVGSHFPLTLEDMDAYGRLIVRSRRKYLGLSAGDGAVLLDQLGHDAAERFDTERKRGNVKQKDIL